MIRKKSSDRIKIVKDFVARADTQANQVLLFDEATCLHSFRFGTKIIDNIIREGSYILFGNSY